MIELKFQVTPSLEKDSSWFLHIFQTFPFLILGNKCVKPIYLCSLLQEGPSEVIRLVHPTLIGFTW